MGQRPPVAGCFGTAGTDRAHSGCRGRRRHTEISACQGRPAHSRCRGGARHRPFPHARGAWCFQCPIARDAEPRRPGRGVPTLRSGQAVIRAGSMEAAVVQRRTLRLLFITQIISGIGVAVGASVGALLAADIAGVGMSGLAQSAIVVGTALFAVPATAIVQSHGRRPSLATGYLVAMAGALIVVTAAMRGSVPLLFGGFFLFGGGNAAGLQARYAAVDLAPAALRGRHLSLIIWATTIGAVMGPSLAPLAGASLD